MRFSFLERRSPLIFSTLAILFSGCGGLGRDNPLAGAAQALSATDLQGSWKSDCHPVSSRVWSYERRTIEFNSNDAILATEAYDDSDCSTRLGQIRHFGKFQTGGSSPGGNNLEFSLKSASFRPDPAGIASIFTPSSRFCGVTDPAPNVEYEVTAKSGGDNCVDKAPVDYYDIYAIEGRTLFLGAGPEAQKTDGSKRPLSVDRALPFAKQ